MNDQTISSRLRDAGTIISREKGHLFFLRVAQWLPAGAIGLFLTDAVLHLPAEVRLAALLGIIAVVVVCAVVGLFAIPRRQTPLIRTARTLQDRDKGLGTKPVNYLQLMEQREAWPEGSLTRDMTERAIRSYREQLAHTDMLQLARTSAVTARLKRSALVWACSMVALLLAGSISLMELQRFIDPFGDHPPYSLTRLEILEPTPEGTEVIYGRGLLVRAAYHGHRPGALFLTFHEKGHAERKTTVPLYQREDNEFSQYIDSVLTPLEIYVHTRGGRSRSPRRDIRLILTPQLESASVRIEPPSYTRERPRERPLQFKTLRALEGSRLTFSLVSNRPLSAGHVEMLQTGADTQRIPMVPSAEKTVTCTFPAESSGTLSFSMIDESGIASTERWETALSIVHDLPPSIAIRSPGERSIAAMTYELKINIQAGDDYGLSVIRLHSGTNGTYGEPVTWELPAGEAQKSAVVEHTLKLWELGLTSGDELTFHAEAIDIAPSPHLSRSDVIRVLVVTEEEYNDLLRRQRDMRDALAKYSDLVNRLRRLVEEQKRLKAETAALQEELTEAAADKDRTVALERNFRDLQARQAEINRNLGKLADEMESFVRETPLYDVESEFADDLQGYAESVRTSAAANQTDMQKLPTATPESTMPALSAANLAAMQQAAAEQLERLGAVEGNASSDVLEHLEHLALLHDLVKDFNQFKLLYLEHQELVAQLAAYRDKGVLLREDQLAMKELAGVEREIGKKLDILVGKLNDHAAAAETFFPKAADSGRMLAEAINDLRLAARCAKATSRMLVGDGAQSYALAEDIRKDMEALFGSTCESACTGASKELDQYLKLVLGAPSGRNFQQMSQCLKFNWGEGEGLGFGLGRDGMAGTSGYAVRAGPATQLLGGEANVTEDRKSALRGDGGNGEGTAADAPVNRYDEPDVLAAEVTSDAESEAVTGEMAVEKYRDVIEKYFERVTRE